MKKSILLMMAVIACNAQAVMFYNVSSKYGIKVRTTGQDFNKGVELDPADSKNLSGTSFNATAFLMSDRSMLKDSSGVVDYEIPKKFVDLAIKENKGIALDAGKVVFWKPWPTNRIRAKVGKTVDTQTR